MELRGPKAVKIKSKEASLYQSVFLEAQNSVFDNKPVKILQIARKLPGKPKLELPDTFEEDFSFQTQGNIRDFLKLKNPVTGAYQAQNQNELKNPFFSSKKEFEFIGQTNTRVQHQKVASRYASTKTVVKTNPLQQFQKRIRQIEQGKKKEEWIHKRKLKQMSIGQKILEKRQERVLKSYNKMVKVWSRIQTNIALSVKKNPSDLAVSRAEEYRQKIQEWDLLDRRTTQQEKAGYNLWYSSLRSSPFRGPIQRYQPVGNSLAGIYAAKPRRSQSTEPFIRKPDAKRTTGKTFKQTEYFLQRLNQEPQVAKPEVSELQVIGQAKLPLELDCVKILGVERLKLEPKEDQPEETIGEHYDSILKY